MLDVELRRLRKSELLELLLEIEEENEQLARENRQLKEQLEDKRVSLASVGSIAEASLQMSELLEAAQATADIYLLNVREMTQDEERIRALYLGKTRELCLDHAREVEELCLDYAREVDRLCKEAMAEQGNASSGQAQTSVPTGATEPSSGSFVSLEAQVQALFDDWDAAEGERS